MNETKTLSMADLPEDIQAAIRAGQDKKAENLVVLDLHGLSSFTDFFVIMHGNSGRQNNALSDNIELELKKMKTRPFGIEGQKNGEWILMDYGHFIVHIFAAEKRQYYSLEKLWGDAPRLFV